MHLFYWRRASRTTLCAKRDPLIQSRKCMSLKFTEQLCVMTMKNDAKFGQELTCSFNTDMGNLSNFDPSTQRSQKFPP